MDVVRTARLRWMRVAAVTALFCRLLGVSRRFLGFVDIQEDIADMQGHKGRIRLRL